MKKRLLILYATYGSGHKAIAEYIKKYFEETGEYECLALELISYSVPLFGKITQKGADYLMTKLPIIWSILYYSFDNKLTAYISGNITTKLIDNKDLEDTIKKFNPDITIATHFYGTDIMKKYNKKGITNSKIVTVVTDYKSHEFWLNSIKEIDAIIVSSYEEKIHLLRRGLKSKQIHTTGIPICPKIASDMNRKELLNKFKINNGKKNVLFFVGGGNGALLNLVYLKELLKNNYDCNVLFISGKNKKAYQKAKEYVSRYKKKNVKVYGFITNVSDFYKVSDFVITKPGGAQVTECLYFNKPMILIKGNGGQEIGNRKYLVGKGYAKNVRSRWSFNKHLKELLENEKEYEKMKKKISDIDQSKSMEQLYKIINKM